MQVIDIILLSNAQNERLRKMTEDCLSSLLVSEPADKIRFNILVFESSKTKTYNYPYCQTLFPKVPFGYNKYMNMGLKKTQSPFVCLCNNDLIFQQGWASSILKAFDNFPNLKSASPFCRFNHPERNIPAYNGLRFGYGVRDEVSGWCILFKREILQTTGYLDERLKFWYSDNDYAKTLEKHGIQHALVTDSFVDHLESQTLSTCDQKEQLRLTGWEKYYFEYKWGNRSYLSYLNHKRKQFFKSL